MASAAKPEDYGPRPGFLALQPTVERGVAVVSRGSRTQQHAAVHEDPALRREF